MMSIEEEFSSVDHKIMESDTPVKARKFPPPPLPIKKSFSYNSLNAKAQSFLPRNNSISSLQNTSLVIGAPMMSPSAMMGPPSPMRGPPSPVWGPPGPLSPMMGQPSPMMGPPSPMRGPPSPIWVASPMRGPPSPMRGPPSPIWVASPMTSRPQSPMITHPPSPMTLGTTTTTTTTQKTSFVIPQRTGPPTLLHVFTTTTSLPSPTSPAPAPLFTSHVSPSFHREVLMSPVGLAPQPLSPAMVAALSVPPPRGSWGKPVAAMGGQKSWPLDEASRKILHQVEFYFSDLNIATTDHLIKFMNKDPEGYVPISVVASFKKIRSGTSSNAQLANILRNSEKLVVSEDGRRVKRVDHVTEAYMEELQSRIVVAENLPQDYSHKTLMRIFSAVGSVKAIRTCQPSTGAAVKSDTLRHSNKLHAFVEYESLYLAEKAVFDLSDKKNWRSGLKVRFLIRSQVRSSPPRSVKSVSENGSSVWSDDSDEEEGEKRARGRGWGKGRERVQYQPPNFRGGSIIGSTPSAHVSSNNEQHKQAPVPRMPDGTRGFSMGRGKRIAA